MKNNKNVLERAKELCEFLNKGVTQYHVVAQVKEILIKNGFEELDYGKEWSFNNKVKGFVNLNDSGLFAFDLNKENLNQGIKFIASHIDSPCLKIKTGSDVLTSNGNLYLNVEVYGGAILNTWLDRGLSIAGKVYVESENKIEQILIDFKEEIVFIANCPIHLNREINSGFSLNKQKHMMPMVLTTYAGEVRSLKGLIEKYFNINEENIVDFDLYLYDPTEAKIIGANKEFIQSKKIDDLAMGEASINALINCDSNSNKFVCLFDGEEIGSSMIQGAYSNTLYSVLDRIYDSLNISKEHKEISIYNSFVISADMAHAYNSNYSEKFDEYNKCLINKGVVIKQNCNRSYITTGETSSYFISLCKKVNVPYQIYYNRSDMQGGSTLGPILNKYLSIKGLDVGNPMFAMHSCRETAGVLDHYYMSKVFEEYFK